MSKKGGMRRYRIEDKQLNKLHYQFDICCCVEGIDPTFISMMLEDRYFNDKYYIPKIKDEVVLRKNYYLKKPNRVYHKDWINKVSGYRGDKNE